MPPTQVGRWKNELHAQAASLFDTKHGPKPADPSASPERRYSEIGRVKMALAWRKKKSGLTRSHIAGNGSAPMIPSR